MWCFFFGIYVIRTTTCFKVVYFRFKPLYMRWCISYMLEQR